MESTRKYVWVEIRDIGWHMLIGSGPESFKMPMEFKCGLRITELPPHITTHRLLVLAYRSESSPVANYCTECVNA